MPSGVRARRQVCSLVVLHRVLAQIFLKNMQIVPQFFLITRSNEVVPGFLEKKKNGHQKHFFRIWYSFWISKLFVLLLIKTTSMSEKEIWGPNNFYFQVSYFFVGLKANL